MNIDQKNGARIWVKTQFKIYVPPSALNQHLLNYIQCTAVQGKLECVLK